RRGRAGGAGFRAVLASQRLALGSRAAVGAGAATLPARVALGVADSASAVALAAAEGGEVADLPHVDAADALAALALHAQAAVLGEQAALAGGLALKARV